MSASAKQDFPETTVRMALSKLPLEPYQQFKYDCFRNNGEGMSKTMTALIMRFTEQEQWNGVDVTSESSSQSTFWVNKTGNSKQGCKREGRRGRHKNTITCWTCGKKGHFQYECKKDTNNNKNKTSNSGFSARNHHSSSEDENEVQEVYWCNKSKKQSKKHAHFAFSSSLVTYPNLYLDRVLDKTRRQRG